MSVLLDAGVLARSWLGSLGMLAVQGTVLALVALVLTRAGRLRPSWQAAIWLVVAIKLALPWGPAMPWSLSDVFASLSARDVAVAPLVITPDLVRIAPSTPSVWPSLGWLALVALWAGGAAVVLARAALAQARTTRAARTAPHAPDDAQALVRELARRIGVRAPRLAIGRSDVGPHVVGVLRAVIVVPPALLDEVTLLRAALLHELAHVRRRDTLARMVQIVAGAMMWWLPTMRLVHRKLELAREAACDAYVLESGEVARPAYARLLVRMAGLHAAAAPALAAHHAHALDARVAAVLGPPARSRMTHLHRIVLAGWAVLALGGARSSAATSKPEVCQYTPQLAEALLVSFPQADLDGDGLLSRDEACGLQAELRRVPGEERVSRFTPENEARVQALLAEPLCCNCGDVEVYSSPELTSCQNLKE